MCLLLIAVVFTLVYVIGGILSVFIGDWPYPLRLLLTLAIEVPLLTYLIMPALTRRLSGWIYPATRTAT
jgi:antibiotic biosynthesis monooxygenase (ABM) superfamily enzyme